MADRAPEQQPHISTSFPRRSGHRRPSPRFTVSAAAPRLRGRRSALDRDCSMKSKFRVTNGSKPPPEVTGDVNPRSSESGAVEQPCVMQRRVPSLLQTRVQLPAGSGS